MQPLSSQPVADYICLCSMHILYINLPRILLTEGVGFDLDQVLELAAAGLWCLFSEGAVSRDALTPEGGPQSNINLNPRCEASNPNAA
jgi:hypothetical protein